MENGFECGCLRFRIQSNDNYSCACKHDLCYHENFRKNKFNPYKKPIAFKLICLFGKKSNQKIQEGK
jgi:hypothetical protein